MTATQRPICKRHGAALLADGTCVGCRANLPADAGGAPMAAGPKKLGVWILVAVVCGALWFMAKTPSKRAVSAQPGASATVGGWKNGEVHVVMYATPHCPHCRFAREHMAKKGVPYTERDVTTSESAQQRLLQLNSRGSVPTFEIGDEVVVGFSAEGLDDAIGRARK